MKYIITSLLIGITLLVNSQEVERSVVSSSGDSYSNSSGQLSVTIGEVVTATVSDGTNELTQGFHQTKITVTNVENHLVDFEMNVFPNPTSKLLTIKIKELKDKMLLTMHGVDGKIVLRETVQSLETKLSVEKFAKGTYFLNLIEDDQLIKSYKVLKQ